jgi:hypothetical protein
MKKMIRFTWVNHLAVVALGSVLFSFSTIIGAHNVQVFLDDKMVIDQYVDSRSVVPTLNLDAADKHEQLIIKYNECGRNRDRQDYYNQRRKESSFERLAL